MRRFNLLQLIGFSTTENFNTEFPEEPDFHHHDLEDGGELLDETLHMHEQPFKEHEEQNYFTN